MKINPICKDCGVGLDDENWYASYQKTNHYLCKNCNAKRKKQWMKANPEKARAMWTRARHKQGAHPFNENKECGLYLGVYIAEEVSSQAFKNVQRMPNGNQGFDLICNKGKIDVKSACKGKIQNNWIFHIRHNTIADYFLCLAFDNREDLTPLHVWLIPGDKLNHLVTATIRPSTIHRWDEYKFDITKISQCCVAMKMSDSYNLCHQPKH